VKRLPDYLKRPIIDTETTKNVRRILKTNCLNTVCESARCPNKNECYTKNTATFLIMGQVCTRNCRFCNISTAEPLPLDESEPKNIANAIQELGLKYAVITSVTRDDLTDGGAEHFAKCIEAVKSKKGKVKSDAVGRAYQPDDIKSPPVKIEVLTPDFKNDKKSLDTIIQANPDVFNHNIETVPSLYKKARPQAIYQRSLDVLRYVKENSDIMTKSGIMVGLGETFEELEQTLKDLKEINCDIVTIGQYIQPSKAHLPVEKYYTIEEFDRLKALAKKIGIKNYQFGPLVRSSYHAAEVFDK